jgi:high-affinity nickel permease
MSLVDTTDSVLMVRAYGWAFVKPIRKLYYNLTITSVSGRRGASDRRRAGVGSDR